MAPKILFELKADETALVLFRPTVEGGLWDPRISALIDTIEDELGIFVTCAGRGRGSMRLDDAASAARFMGCESMVVVAPIGAQPSSSELNSASVRFQSPVVAVETEPSPRAVIAGYRSACRLAERAA
jgi:hypothetical protein